LLRKYGCWWLPGRTYTEAGIGAHTHLSERGALRRLWDVSQECLRGLYLTATQKKMQAVQWISSRAPVMNVTKRSVAPPTMSSSCCMREGSRSRRSILTSFRRRTSFAILEILESCEEPGYLRQQGCCVLVWWRLAVQH
jgi:hypothetical protein